MKKFLFIIFLLNLQVTTTSCQVFNWVNTFNGLNRRTLISKSIVDAYGNIITIGQQSTGMANGRIAITKLNRSRNNSFNFESFNRGYNSSFSDLTSDFNGDIYLTGNLQDYSSNTSFVMKLDTSGNIIWKRPIETRWGNYEIAVDEKGNYFISIYDTIKKFNREGEVIWIKKLNHIINKIILLDNYIITKGDSDIVITNLTNESTKTINQKCFDLQVNNHTLFISDSNGVNKYDFKKQKLVNLLKVSCNYFSVHDNNILIYNNRKELILYNILDNTTQNMKLKGDFDFTSIHLLPNLEFYLTGEIGNKKGKWQRIVLPPYYINGNCSNFPIPFISFAKAIKSPPTIVATGVANDFSSCLSEVYIDKDSIDAVVQFESIDIENKKLFVQLSENNFQKFININAEVKSLSDGIGVNFPTYLPSNNYQLRIVAENSEVVSNVLNIKINNLTSIRNNSLYHLNEITAGIKSEKIDSINKASELSEVYLDTNKTSSILFCEANPKNTPSLHINEEIREVNKGIATGKFSNKINFEPCLATRYSDLVDKLSKFNPLILQFSGHGSKKGISILAESGETQILSGEQLAKVLQNVPSVKCVILNSCYSKAQAESIIKIIPIVIGMNSEIQDDASIYFAKLFYICFTNGYSIKRSFSMAQSGVEIQYDTKTSEKFEILLK